MGGGGEGVGGCDEKKKVMIGIDESECSRNALQWALQNLSHTLSHSKLIIFSAQPIHDFGYAYASSFGATPPQLIQSLLDKRRNLTLALLQKAKEICAQHGFDAETATETGNPGEEICEAVEKLEVQLLILGSHRRGTIQKLLMKADGDVYIFNDYHSLWAFLGSVSNYCVQNAKCPVLVVQNKSS